MPAARWSRGRRRSKGLTSRAAPSPVLRGHQLQAPDGPRRAATLQGRPPSARQVSSSSQLARD
ncbi:unnamed protein product [Spirodela intermedia]|uniref:Uncharacterized protein n=2 Tax=Spirodela intermedia TaxID=51605 RepID=A0A7I8LN80_SPIIN|nr:unnamed protein product [Spirodela intermedia]CAA6673475.1 unnamed protein product [Spirodela intermedia]CAA7410704.1 unnamed protein product [Spirodela intermedia]